MSLGTLPALTHLQFIVIGALLAEEQSGKDIRRELKRQGVRRTAPAFYQMMGRLEEAGWIDGFYTQEVVDAQIIKERRYRVKPAGVRAWNSTRDFYAAVSARFDRVAHV
jgi:DNA-binding PadR family transcriptional regulator